jgi:Transposase DDE domain
MSKKLKRARKEHVWRYVISTRAADGETIRRWGRSRWRIEAFFKTLKFRFELDQFGQRTVRGAFQFIILGLLAFALTFWEVTLPVRCMFRVRKRSRRWWIGRCWIGVWWREVRQMSWSLRFRRWPLNELWNV